MNKLLLTVVLLIATSVSGVIANDFYNASGNPEQGSANSSAVMRAEFASIEDGFDIVGDLISTPNLLINPDFIVNQDVYLDDENLTSIGEYCYDMWMSTVNTGENGVSVSGESITLEAAASLEQINDDLIANAGKTVTVSVESGTVNVKGGGIVGTQALTATTPYTFTLAVTNTDGIVIERGSTGVFTGLKVGVGSVPTTYYIPQKSEEEIKCFRYYRVYSRQSPINLPGVITGATTAKFSMSVVVGMSSTPTLTSPLSEVFSELNVEINPTLSTSGYEEQTSGLEIYVTGLSGYTQDATAVLTMLAATLDSRY